MPSEKEICNRFLICISELDLTLSEVANRIGTDAPYLSRLKKNPNPKVPAALIATLCAEFNFSPHYILLGKGDKKARPKLTKEDKLLNLVEDLLHALLEIKPKWTDATRQLAQEAKKRIQ